MNKISLFFSEKAIDNSLCFIYNSHNIVIIFKIFKIFKKEFYRQVHNILMITEEDVYFLSKKEQHF